MAKWAVGVRVGDGWKKKLIENNQKDWSPLQLSSFSGYSDAWSRMATGSMRSSLRISWVNRNQIWHAPLPLNIRLVSEPSLPAAMIRAVSVEWVDKPGPLLYRGRISEYSILGHSLTGCADNFWCYVEENVPTQSEILISSRRWEIHVSESLREASNPHPLAIWVHVTHVCMDINSWIVIFQYTTPPDWIQYQTITDLVLNLNGSEVEHVLEYQP